MLVTDDTSQLLMSRLKLFASPVYPGKKEREGGQSEFARLRGGEAGREGLRVGPFFQKVCNIGTLARKCRGKLHVVEGNQRWQEVHKRESGKTGSSVLKDQTEGGKVVMETRRREDADNVWEPRVPAAPHKYDDDPQKRCSRLVTRAVSQAEMGP
jgi:hypothetical protein